MRRIWSILFSRECAHVATSIVQSAGVRREICEACGLVGFAIQPNTVDVDWDLPEVAGL